MTDRIQRNKGIEMAEKVVIAILDTNNAAAKTRKAIADKLSDA